jgi:hypothetical protein
MDKIFAHHVIYFSMCSIDSTEQSVRKNFSDDPKMSAENVGGEGILCEDTLTKYMNPEKKKSCRKFYRGEGAAGVSSGTSCLSRMV